MRRFLSRTALFAVSLFLFILALTLMKEGARGLGPLVRDVFHVTNPANALGFGWLFAYVVMSGSPVAASALTFLDAGVIDEMSAFTMVTGSRLGASFFVLLIGFVYVLRGRNRAASLGMGLLALVVTGITHLAALPVGAAFLRSGVLYKAPYPRSAGAASVVEMVFDPIVAALLVVLPRWALFPAGLIIILISFSLFDRCLPQIHVGDSQIGRMSRLVFRPWIMFAIGALVTLITLSVSVSLSLLIPLNHRGYVRRENAVPYIMGAGITTFVDTLLAALLLNNPAAFAVVLAQMVSVTLVSAMFLAVGFASFERVTLHMAATLAAATDAQVTLLTVAVSEGRRAHAETVAVQAGALLRQLVGEVETRVAVGRAAGRIIREAQSGGYDLLVIGERPGHRLIHRILANTVDRLTGRAPCPVLVARGAGLPVRMLICESGRRPLVADRLAEKLKPVLDLCREATLLHVMSQMAAGPGVAGRDLRLSAVEHMRRDTQEGKLLREGLAALEEAGVPARPLLRHGRVVGEVIDETQAGHYDLVVIGAFRATGWDRLMLSDQAHAILAGTHQPLLVV